MATHEVEGLASAMSAASKALTSLRENLDLATVATLKFNGAITMSLCPKHHARLLRMVRPLAKLRAQAIAKARGKNWRNVR